jgi:hypothetical protein
MKMRAVLVLSSMAAAGCAADGSQGPSTGDALAAFDSASQSIPCRVEGRPVSCTLALWLVTGPDVGATPRERCETLCAQVGDAVDGTGMCGDGVDCGYCAWVSLTEICGDCSALPDEPLDESYCDGDPCTLDVCEGDHCTHEPYEWIGGFCQRSNDLGTCEGVRFCEPAVCGWQAGHECTKSDDVTCGAPVPGWEAPDGIDNDCDGEIDEDPGSILPLTQGGQVEEVAGDGLADGSFVAAWTDQVSSHYVLRVRVASEADPLGGAPFEVAGSVGQQAGPRVVGLSGGGFAVAWLHAASGGSVGRARIFGADGAPLTGPIPYGAPAGLKASLHDVTAFGDGFAVAWAGSRPFETDRDEQIRLELFAADGESLGSAQVAPSAGRPSIAALLDGTLAVAWAQFDGPQEAWPVMMRRYAADGQALDETVMVLAAGDGPSSPDAFDTAPLADGGLLIGWSSQATGMRFVAVDADGTPRGPVAALGSKQLVLGALVPSESGAVAIWHRFMGPSVWRGEILASALSPNGVATGEPLALGNGCETCRAPSAGRLADGRGLALWVRGELESSYSGPAEARARLVD